MNLVIFSTPSKHHTYFINKLEPYFNIQRVFYETRVLTKDYPIGPFLQEEQDAFEDRFFDKEFGGVNSFASEKMKDNTRTVETVNLQAVQRDMMELAPDLVITFGVGLVKPEIYNIPKWGTVNVHRGWIQKYRGLDSDLWAIYNRRLDEIGVTLHYVNERFDTGGILAQELVPIEESDQIFHLRYKTTVVATRLMLKLLKKFHFIGNKLEVSEQEALGKYYSAMPLKNKFECLKYFQELR